jgi:hypothetical protein
VFRISSTSFLESVEGTKCKSKSLSMFYRKWHGYPLLQVVDLLPVSLLVLFRLELAVFSARLHKIATYCKVVLSSCSIKECISGLVLYAFPFTDLFNPINFSNLQPKPSPHSSGLAVLPNSKSDCVKNITVEGYGHVERKVCNKIQKKHVDYFLLKSCPSFMLLC